MSERQAIPRPEDFRFHCEIEVRFRDLDAFRHVNNAVYATYFEVARLAYVRALGLGADGHGIDDLLPFIMLDLYCRYVDQAVLGDVLLGYVRTVKVGTRSFVFEYLVTRRRDGAVMAVGHSTLVYYDYAARRTLPVAPEFRARLERMEGRAFPA